MDNNGIIKAVIVSNKQAEGLVSDMVYYALIELQNVEVQRIAFQEAMCINEEITIFIDDGEEMSLMTMKNYYKEKNTKMLLIASTPERANEFIRLNPKIACAYSLPIYPAYIAERVKKIHEESIIKACSLKKFEYSIYFQRIEAKAASLLERVGIQSKLAGYKYLKFAIAYCSFKPMSSFKNEIYPVMEEIFNKTMEAMERAMRYAIERAWNTGDIKAQEELFGYTISSDKGKPILRELVCMLAVNVSNDSTKNT